MKIIILVILILLLSGCFACRPSVQMTRDGAIQTLIEFDEMNKVYTIEKFIRYSGELTGANFNETLLDAFNLGASDLCNGFDNIKHIKNFGVRYGFTIHNDYLYKSSIKGNVICK